MLEQLQTTLSEVEEAQRAKQAALTGLNTPALYESAEVEGRLAQALYDQRQSLIESSSSGIAPNSLRALIEQLPAEERPPLLAGLDAVKSRAKKVKERVAMNWLTTWRLNEYVSDMLSIVAHAGQPATEEAHHGLMLDSSA